MNSGPKAVAEYASSERVRPLISVITVCRNEVGRIQRTIDSILGQRTELFEWIVVDGASTDGTLAILQAHNDAIAKLISEPDRGIYDAMNKGARAASGEWLLFLNGGDAFVNRSTVASIAPLLEKSDVDVLVGAHVRVWPDGRAPVKKIHSGALDLHHFYRRPVNHQSAFIRRRAFEKFGPYDTTFKYIADWDFFVRAVLGGARMERCDVLVAEYDATGVSAQKKHSSEMKRERRRLRSHFSLIYRMRRFASDIFVSLLGRGSE